MRLMITSLEKSPAIATETIHLKRDSELSSETCPHLTIFQSTNRNIVIIT